MHDYLWLTPVLTVIVVSLVGFVGCNWFFDLQETEPYPPPSTPTGLAAAPRDSAVDLSWDPYPDADKLTIRIGTSQGSHPTGEDLSPTATSHSWTGLVNDQTYFFALTANAGGVESAESEEVSAIPGLYGVVVPFLNQTQLGTLRQFDEWMGIRFTTGPNNLTLRALGRWFDAGAAGTHPMKISAASDPMTPLAAVTVTKASPGTRDEFVYANVATTVPLNANTEYYVVSRETSAGDPFHDADLNRVAIIDPLAGAEVRAAFEDANGNYTVAPMAGGAYGPVNILYTRP